MELAKDVSAIANSGDGLILIGYSTEQGDSDQIEYAAALKAIPSSLIDEKQFRDCIQQYVYPSLSIEIMRIPCGADKEVCGLRIRVPNEKERPYLVKGSLTEEGKIARTMFGLYRRHGPSNVPYSVEEVQLKLNRAWHANLAVEFESGELRPQTEANKGLERSIEAIESENDLVGCYFQIDLIPRRKLDCYHRGDGKSLTEEIEHWAPTRTNGFSLRNSGEVRYEDGAIVMKYPARSLCRIERDGLLTTVISGEVLTWATAQYYKEQPCINPFALPEFALDTARILVELVAKHHPATSAIRWRAGVRSATGEAFLPTQLLSQTSNPWHSPPRRSEPFDLEMTELVQWSTVSTAGQLALDILEGVYDKFGIAKSQIPLQSDGAISESIIKATGNR